ncbi:hypothetical protein CP082626L3_0340A, partial [Chlamydia psittaci 08-2626_L3]
MCISLVYR